MKKIRLTVGGRQLFNWTPPRDLQRVLIQVRAVNLDDIGHRLRCLLEKPQLGKEILGEEYGGFVDDVSTGNRDLFYVKLATYLGGFLSGDPTIGEAVGVAAAAIVRGDSPESAALKGLRTIQDCQEADIPVEANVPSFRELSVRVADFFQSPSLGKKMLGDTPAGCALDSGFADKTEVCMKLGKVIASAVLFDRRGPQQAPVL